MSSPIFHFFDPGPLSDAELTLRLEKTTARDDALKRVSTYYFEILVSGRRAGGIRFRAEKDFELLTYNGHIGYNVDPEFRGCHRAERACRLLFPLARAHGFTALWITCTPENHASRRTCERLGARLVETIPVPEDTNAGQDGDRFKSRYLLDLP